MYVIGVFRRTALWAIFLTILGAISMNNFQMLYSLAISGGAYILFVLIHIFACKIRKSSNSAGETYISALCYDIIAPFTKIGTFLAVITRKWVIHDDSKFHNFIDGFQVVAGGIWAISIWGIVIFFILKMVL